MLEKLFEAIDDKILTPELKAELEASFNEAIQTKVDAEVEIKIEELSEKAEAFKAELSEKAEAEQAELVEQFTDYSDKVITDFIAESKEALDESIKQEKADMIIEAFDTMIVAGGVDIAKIVEAKDESMVESELAEKVAKYDTLVEENITQAKEIDKLAKAGIIAEMKEGLSIVESEKFTKLADVVDYSKDESYVTKLDTLKESVKGTVVDDEDKKLNENENKDKKTYSHLV